MLWCRTAVKCLLLAVACAGMTLAGETPAATRQTTGVDLSEALRDNFQTDTRKTYEITGNVDWKSGALTLNEQSSLGRALQSGPRCELLLDLDNQRLKMDGGQAFTLLRLRISGAYDICLVWQWDHVKGANGGRISIFKLGPKDEPLKAVPIREFPILATTGTWKIQYRYGLISITQGSSCTGYGFIENGPASPTSWLLTAEGQSAQVRQIQVNTSLRRPNPTPDETVLLNKATRLNKSGLAMYQGGDFSQALSLFTEANAIWQSTLGTLHPHYATSLSNLADVHRVLGEHEKAESFYSQVIEIRRQALGENHPEYCTSLHSLATLHMSRAAYGKALPLFTASQEIRKQVLGGRHVDFAQSLYELAVLYFLMGDYVKAEPLFCEARDIYEGADGENHSRLATCLSSLANLYRTKGEYSKAEPLLSQARDIQQRVLGQNHPRFAQSTNALGLLCIVMGDYARAEPLLLQAQKIQLQALGAEHPDYAVTLSSLAGLYESVGDYAQALRFFTQALDIQKRSLGELHPHYALTLNNLGHLLTLTREYAKAEPLFLQAREIQKRALGQEHPDFALTLNNLAGVYRELGDYSKAEPLLVQSRDIRLRMLGPDHPEYANCLATLAGLYQSMREYRQAEILLLQAHDIRKRVLGENHIEYAYSLNGLGTLYHAMDDDHKAESFLIQSLDIRRRVLGEQHPEYVLGLNNLAMIYNSTGKFSLAEPLLIQALDIRQKILGNTHPDTVDSRNNLAFLYASAAQWEKAEPLFRAALVARTSNTLKVISGLSESRSQEFVNENLFGLAMLLSVGRRIENYSPWTAYDAVWHAQGLVSRTMRCRRKDGAGNSDSVKLKVELQAVQQQLAQWTLLTPKPGQQSHRMQRLQELDNEKERLEQALAVASGPFKESRKSSEPSPMDLMESMPADTAVVHILKTEVREPSATGHGLGKPVEHYEAFVLTKVSRPGSKSRVDSPSYNVTWIHLGSAKPIESSLAKWRQTLQLAGDRGLILKPGRLVDGESFSSPGETPAVKLRTEVWMKIEPHLAGHKRVVLIPDGDLHFLPWSALPGRDPGTFLIEEYALSTAQDGQQLFQIVTESPLDGTSTVLLVGGVLYGQIDSTPELKRLDIDMAKHVMKKLINSQPLTAARLSWPELPGTAVEVEQLAKLAGARRMTLLRSADALEDRLRREMPRARFIHLATHGFFADESFRSAFLPDETGKRLFGGTEDMLTKQRAGVTYRHPLLLSGIVLAEANLAPTVASSGLETGQDGILTAEEVVNLDLRQSELVVLSACETGLGRVGGGEGVFGLQRAFAIAGARTAVASLWKVSDDATQILMAEFYSNMWQKGLPKLDALRQAQLTMLRRFEPQDRRLRGLNLKAQSLPKSPEIKSEILSPYYWAAFTLSGDWR